MREESLYRRFDWLTVGLYFILLLISIPNIYATVFTIGNEVDLLSMHHVAGKQILWIVVASFIALVLVLLDFRLYFSLAFFAYLLSVISLLGVLVIGVEVNGAKAWYEIGSFRIMPAEFAKVGVALGLAKYFDSTNVRFGINTETLTTIGIIILPSVIILAQNETGSILVLFSFAIMFYRQGLHFIIPLSGIIFATLFIATVAFITFDKDILVLDGIITGVFFILAFIQRKKRQILILIAILLSSFIGIIHSTSYIFPKLPSHQQDRIKALLNPGPYKRTVAYQSVNAMKGISSGYWNGSGYLKGSLTQTNFIPEQHTDFIFTTVAEEHGFWGSAFLVIVYLGLISRIVYLSERQKSTFARVFGYCLLSALLFHFIVNVGMTIGLVPVVGIPLPFVSYGGSSLWAFTIMLFIFLKLDVHRSQILARD